MGNSAWEFLETLPFGTLTFARPEPEKMGCGYETFLPQKLVARFRLVLIWNICPDVIGQESAHHVMLESPSRSYVHG